MATIVMLIASSLHGRPEEVQLDPVGLMVAVTNFT